MIETTVLLLNRKAVTAGELARRFDVSTRTIYRDIAELSLAGIPVYMTKGKGGGISLVQEYALDKTILSERDRESIILALRTLQVTKHPGAVSALEKVAALLSGRSGDSGHEWVRVDLTRWGSDPNESDKFARVRAAILDRRVIAFVYVDSSGNRTEREVEPLTLVYKGLAWYLYCYCRLRGDFRLLRISRIKGLNVRDERFERRVPPANASLNYEDPTKRVLHLRLRFGPDVMHRVYDDFDDRNIARNPDGTLDVVTSFPEDEWVYGYLLSYGKNVEVLEPSDVREGVAERLAEAIGQYRG